MIICIHSIKQTEHIWTDYTIKRQAHLLTKLSIG